MEPFAVASSSAASAHSQGPPQPVAVSSTLPANASPNGRTPGGGHNNDHSENDTCSPSKNGGRLNRKNRLSVESLTCPSCGKVCSNKSKYLRHKSTHSEDRPYSCPQCKKGFKWVEYLSKHMKQQHPNSTLGKCTVVNILMITNSSLCWLLVTPTPVDTAGTIANSPQAVTSTPSEGNNVVGIKLMGK